MTVPSGVNGSTTGAYENLRILNARERALKKLRELVSPLQERSVLSGLYGRETTSRETGLTSFASSHRDNFVSPFKGRGGGVVILNSLLLRGFPNFIRAAIKFSKSSGRAWAS